MGDSARDTTTETTFLSIIDEAPDAIFVGTGGRFAFVNKAMCSLIGVAAADDLIGTPALDIVHPDYRQAVKERMRALDESGTRQPAREVVFLHADGSEIPVETKATPITYEGRDSSLVFVRDITERKAVEAELAYQHDLMQYVIEHDRSAIAVHDTDLRYIYVSQRYLDDYRVTEAEVIGKHHYDVFPDIPEKWREVHRRALAGEVLRADEDFFIREDGSVDWTSWECRPWYEKDGSIGGIILYTEVINARKEAEQELARHRDHLEEIVAERTRELEQLNVELAEATKAKSAFLASMSHELRTPLNSIIGFSGMMLQGMVGPLSEEQEKQIGMVYRSGRHLLSLVDEILDLTKIESGLVTIEYETFDPSTVLSEVAGALSPLATEKALEVVVRPSADLGLISSDYGKVKQVLLNLAGNAVKFTDFGRVELAAFAGSDEHVEFTVTDTGPGIPAEHVEKIFEPFVQIEGGAQSKPGGTGLGLSICREFALLLGGEITVESEIGSGSAFTFRLPRRPPDDGP